jgi:hypothetical protein
MAFTLVAAPAPVRGIDNRKAANSVRLHPLDGVVKTLMLWRCHDAGAHHVGYFQLVEMPPLIRDAERDVAVGYDPDR